MPKNMSKLNVLKRGSRGKQPATDDDTRTGDTVDEAQVTSEGTTTTTRHNNRVMGYVKAGINVRDTVVKHTISTHGINKVFTTLKEFVSSAKKADPPRPLGDGSQSAADVSDILKQFQDNEKCLLDARVKFWERSRAKAEEEGRPFDRLAPTVDDTVKLRKSKKTDSMTEDERAEYFEKTRQYLEAHRALSAVLKTKFDKDCFVWIAAIADFVLRELMGVVVELFDDKTGSVKADELFDGNRFRVTAFYHMFRQNRELWLHYKRGEDIDEVPFFASYKTSGSEILKSLCASSRSGQRINLHRATSHYISAVVGCWVEEIGDQLRCVLNTLSAARPNRPRHLKLKNVRMVVQLYYKTLGLDSKLAEDYADAATVRFTAPTSGAPRDSNGHVLALVQQSSRPKILGSKRGKRAPAAAMPIKGKGKRGPKKTTAAPKKTQAVN
jgi:hypothetical protein